LGNVSGMLGTAGGAAGTGFSGPEGVSITAPVTGAMAQQGYQDTQTGLKQQQALLQALQAQNGIQNQSSVFTQQQALANQLQGLSNGQGPNPALNQLAQSTGQNVAQQNALMAGQRGAGQNVGLMARQAAMQGANTQQQAAGQAATLSAQQQLGYTNALQQQQQALAGTAGTQVANQMGATQGYSQAAQNEQANLYNSIAGVNAANVGMQSNINSNNAALAGQTMQQQSQMQGSIMNGAGSLMSMLADGGEVTQVSSPSINVAPPAQIPPPPPSSSGGGGGGGGGAGIMGLLAMLADGGQVHRMASGGNTQSSGMPASGSQPQASSKFGQFIKTMGANMQQNQSTPGAKQQGTSQNPYNQGLSSLGQGVAHLLGLGSGSSSDSGDSQYSQSGFSPDQIAQERSRADAQTQGGLPSPNDPSAQVSGAYTPNQSEVMPASNDTGEPMAAKGGKVPALLSPGEVYLTPKKAKEVANKGKDPIKHGEKIPGKPKYPGNDYRNDTYKKTLDEGGLVIPNKVMQSPNAHWEALKFVRQHIKGSNK